MGFVKSFVEGKRFESLRADLKDEVRSLERVLKECEQTLSKIKNELENQALESGEQFTELQQKLLTFQEKVSSPIQNLIEDKSLLEQINASENRRKSNEEEIVEYEVWKKNFRKNFPNHYNRGQSYANFMYESNKRQAEMEANKQKDLQALMLLFEGQEGIGRIASALQNMRDTLRETRNYQEELDYILSQLNQELIAEIDELEELDDCGERMKRLAGLI